MSAERLAEGAPVRAAWLDAQALNTALAPWFVPLRAVPETAQARIFMFPYAGGGPGALRDYGRAWPAGLVPFAAQLPGRERRIMEPPLRRAVDAARGLAAALSAARDRPFVLFGHSLGAMLAFETARLLQAAGGPLPLRLVVSGFALGASPVCAYHHLSDADFVAALVALGGMPVELAQHRALMSMVLPRLRADFEMAETFVPLPGPRLRCPITALAGLQDAEALPATMRGWAGVTESTCTTHALPGSHFFITECVDAIVRIVCEAIVQLPAAEHPPPARADPVAGEAAHRRVS